MKVPLIIKLNRISKLVFMKIGIEGYLLKLLVNQGPEDSDIHKGRAENAVVLFPDFQFVEFFCEIRPSQPHAPFPFAGRHSQKIKLVGKMLLQPSEKQVVRAAAIWFKNEYLQIEFNSFLQV